MTVHPFDTVKYHGEVCVVEQTWDTLEEAPMCCLRELENNRHGTYFVDQDSVRIFTGS